MNNSRRKSLQQIISKLEELKADLESIRDEEQECLDNLPEAFQLGDKGDTMQASIDSMDYAFDYLQDAIEELEEAQ